MLADILWKVKEPLLVEKVNKENSYTGSPRKRGETPGEEAPMPADVGVVSS